MRSNLCRHMGVTHYMNHLNMQGMVVWVTDGCELIALRQLWGLAGCLQGCAIKLFLLDVN